MDSPTSTTSTASKLTASNFLPTWARAIRLHQWVKNALIFLPALLGHVLLHRQMLSLSLIAFVSFGLCASSVYLTNDLFDLRADRAHPRKRFRPLASGAITPRAGIVAAVALFVGGAALAFSVNTGFVLVLSCYYVVTWSYSVRLKRIALLDVMILAGLYTIRIIAGAVATDVAPSFWLLAFSVFVFLSLALIKRYAEVVGTRASDSASTSHRPYGPEDMPLILSLGTAAGYSAIVVIALYINSPESQAIYHHHKPLWLICPLMLFWISRTWLLTARGKMQDDPVVFAVRDPISLVMLALIVLIVLAAI
jgi:4-hydroxybenzoate polyprenyltransferase